MTDVPYPSYSYLSPATIGMALGLARELVAAAEQVRLLVSGPSNNMAMGTFGRAGDRLVAIRHWVGPHRDTFDQLMQNEMESAQLTTERLQQEADAWARFWATATNARNDRLHDEAMADHRQASADHQVRMTEYENAVIDDTSAMQYLRPPMPPVAPTRPPPVSVPTAESGYQPTG